MFHVERHGRRLTWTLRRARCCFETRSGWTVLKRLARRALLLLQVMVLGAEVIRIVRAGRADLSGPASAVGAPRASTSLPGSRQWLGMVATPSTGQACVAAEAVVTTGDARLGLVFRVRFGAAPGRVAGSRASARAALHDTGLARSASHATDERPEPRKPCGTATVRSEPDTDGTCRLRETPRWRHVWLMGTSADWATRSAASPSGCVAAA